MHIQGIPLHLLVRFFNINTTAQQALPPHILHRMHRMHIQGLHLLLLSFKHIYDGAAGPPPIFCIQCIECIYRLYLYIICLDLSNTNTTAQGPLPLHILHIMHRMHILHRMQRMHIQGYMHIQGLISFKHIYDSATPPHIFCIECIKCLECIFKAIHLHILICIFLTRIGQRSKILLPNSHVKLDYNCYSQKNDKVSDLGALLVPSVI